MALLPRIGNFFLFVGGFLIFLFVYTDLTGSAYFGYLLAGAPCLLFGMLLRSARKAPPPPPSSRFQMLKRQKKQ